ncbi:MAG: EamA family transporter [Acidobacteriaceae bacterium]
MNAPRPSPRATKTLVFIAVAVLANSFGNLMLALGMNRMPAFAHVPFVHYLVGLLANPFLLPGAALSAVCTLAQISLFSWADLSFVIPCTAASYIVTTLLGEFILGEQVEWARWIGVVLITFGVVLVAKTPVATKPHPAEIPC